MSASNSAFLKRKRFVSTFFSKLFCSDDSCNILKRVPPLRTFLEALFQQHLDFDEPLVDERFRNLFWAQRENKIAFKSQFWHHCFLFFMYKSPFTSESFLCLCVSIRCLSPLLALSDCRFNCHRRCEQLVPRDCPGERRGVNGEGEHLSLEVCVCILGLWLC